MPFPSGGCQTCKLRRIKCDETQPICVRCKKSQRKCYGMRNGPWCSVIHLENTFASGTAKRPRGPRSTRVTEPASVLPILQLPTTDLKTLAITYFRQHHLHSFEDARDLSKTLYNDFLPIWTSRKDCTLLELSGSCIALAVFSQTHNHPPAALAASLKYQKLLQATQKALLTLSAENIELYLFAIFFMGRYEGVLYTPATSSARFRSFSHHAGAMSILKIWKDQYSYDHPATNVIRHSRQGLIRSALLRNAELPEWMLDGRIFGDQGLDLEYYRISVRITKVRYQVSQMLKREHQSPEELSSVLQQLNREAEDIDAALQEWSDCFPNTWRYGQHALQDPYPWPMRDFYTHNVWCYSSPSHAGVWCNYYASRILINSTRLKILELDNPKAVNKQSMHCFTNIQIMADDLASSIPFCLERFAFSKPSTPPPDPPLITLDTVPEIKPYVASMLIWPLTLAASVGGVDEEQQKWFRSELAHVGRIVGVGIFQHAASGGQWPLNYLNFDVDPDMKEW